VGEHRIAVGERGRNQNQASHTLKEELKHRLGVGTPGATGDSGL
jgi:hypothetical protein